MFAVNERKEDIPMTEKSKLTGSDRGAIYVAFGLPYLAMTLLSAETLRRFNPDVRIHIVSNLPESIAADLSFWRHDFDKWFFVDASNKDNRQYKTSVVEYSRDYKMVYLDSDTLITGSFDPVWKFLDFFDICLRVQKNKQTHRFLADVEIFSPELRLLDCPQWNGGVFFFKSNERVRGLFKQWNEMFNEFSLEYDQPSLAKSIICSECRVLSLDARWNGGFRKLDDDWGGIPVVAHYHSDLDAVIERKLRDAAMLLDSHVSENAVESVESYIQRCRRLHTRSLRRRMKDVALRGYRRLWHRSMNLFA